MPGSRPETKELALKTFHPAGGRGNGRSALVVDDEEAACRMICRSLQGSGFTTFQLLDESLTLRAIAAKRPDLIVLDVALGSADGFDVCERVLARTQARDIPVIMVSGRVKKS